MIRAGVVLVTMRHNDDARSPQLWWRVRDQEEVSFWPANPRFWPFGFSWASDATQTILSIPIWSLMAAFILLLGVVWYKTRRVLDSARAFPVEGIREITGPKAPHAGK